MLKIRQTLIATYLITLMTWAIFFAVGVHNTVMGVALVTLCLLFWGQQSHQYRHNFVSLFRTSPYRQVYFWGFAYYVWAIVASLLGDTTYAALQKYAAGHLGLFLLPLLFSCFELNRDIFTKSVLRIVAFWGVVLAVVLVMQILYGYAYFEGIWHERLERPQGLYSHPLTFAYVIIIYLPALALLLGYYPRDLRVLLFTCVTIVALVVSQSRTVQAVTLLTLVAASVLKLRNWQRVFALLTLSAVVLTIALTDNQISNRFHQTFTSFQERNHQGRDIDNRISFWRTHLHLIQQKPWMGHGYYLRGETLEQAYAEMGLADLNEKFEAHNLYLQIAAEFGLIGLFLFLMWLTMMTRLAWRNSAHPADFYFLCSLGALFTASLTQNSLYDAEVRYTWMLAMVLWIMWPRHQGVNHQVSKCQ